MLMILGFEGVWFVEFGSWRYIGGVSGFVFDCCLLIREFGCLGLCGYLLFGFGCWCDCRLFDFVGCCMVILVFLGFWRVVVVVSFCWLISF